MSNQKPKNPFNYTQLDIKDLSKESCPQIYDCDIAIHDYGFELGFKKCLDMITAIYKPEVVLEAMKKAYMLGIKSERTGVNHFDKLKQVSEKADFTYWL